MVFELLHPKIQELVKKRFEKPTLVQELAIPKILEKKNVLIISQTGTGKTESCMLPIFHFLLTEEVKPVAALYITPLKALNRDLLLRFLWWSNKLELDIAVRHGDTSAYERKLQTEFPPLLLISTLETLQPILVGPKIREHLKNIKYVIIDEVHEVVDNKRGIQLVLALERLKKLCKDFQLIMLSATIGEPEKIINFFCVNKKVEIVKAISPKKMEIKVVNPKVSTQEKIKAAKLLMPPDSLARMNFILNSLKEVRSCLIFTNTREFAEILTTRLKKLTDEKIEVHHSSLSKQVRLKVEKEFREQKIKAIVCTSSLQLGIDIGTIDLVIQYLSPRQVTQLIQRVGRSGHGIERESRGIIITSDIDDLLESMVIARKALNEELEPIKFYENCLDVLAHQIVGLTLEYKNLKAEEIFQLIKKTFPYRNFSFSKFLKLCEFLRDLGVIFFEKGMVSKKRRGYSYYFENLSTIPSLKQYKVVNVVDKSVVGVLDEEFVALNLGEGVNFIVKGEPWKVVSIEEDKVLVEPSEEAEAVPAWEGELIPVPFEVAQEVGEVREKVLTDPSILENYPIDENSKQKILKFFERQKKFDVATHRKIVIEQQQNLFVINACFGSLVNETLARFFAAYLTTRVGSIKIRSDPYRIIIELPSSNKELLEEAFKVPKEHFKFYVEKEIENSSLFEWKFMHVAKRFGIIREEAQYSKGLLKRLIEEYHNSFLWEETLREIETEKLDLEKSEEVLEKIQKGEIEVKWLEGLSPLSKLALKNVYAEVVTSEKGVILQLFKQRILNSKVELVCMNCGDWHQSFILKNLPEDIQCKRCGAKLLGISKKPLTARDLKSIKKYVNKSFLTKTEKIKLLPLKKSAELFLVYGKKAVITLAARGVGVENAKRILAKIYLDESSFFKELFNAEKKYLRTKKFWKI